MKFTSIYKNGKPQYFFISIARNQTTESGEKYSEFDFIQPYFLTTTADKPRKGRIYFLENLTGDCNGVTTFYGRAGHGYGYSHSADVYGELVNIIKTLYKKELSENAINELNSINTHEDELKPSVAFLLELKELNAKELQKCP